MNSDTVRAGNLTARLWLGADGRWKWHTYEAGRRTLYSAKDIHKARQRAKAQLVAMRDGKAALADLSPGDREVLALSVWDDLDAAGVAAVLGTTPEAAQKRISRARDRFAAAWEKRGGLSDGAPSRTLTPMEDQ